MITYMYNMEVSFYHGLPMLCIFFIPLTVVTIVSSGKTEDLFKAIEKSGHSQDFQLTRTNVFCHPCKISIEFKSQSHFSNLMRHLTSEQHRAKSTWTVTNPADGTYKIISTVQKTTLDQFFNTARKYKAPISSSVLVSPKMSSTASCSNISLPTIIAQDILRKESNHVSNERKLQLAKSRQLLHKIISEERLYFISEGQQNQQFIEQLTTTMEGIQSVFCQKVEFLLSKLNYMTHIPKVFLSNLVRLSAQISIDLEKTESNNKDLLAITENFVIQQYQTLSKIFTLEKQIRTSNSVSDILEKVQQSLWKEDSYSTPETLVQLSILMDRDDFLSKFLKDIVHNLSKRRPTWSETTLNMFSLLLNYGGPTTTDLISKNFGGPRMSTVYIKARQAIQVENTLKPETFLNAAQFYHKILPKNLKLKDIIFTVAIDATPILPLVRARGNNLIGFATEHRIEISSADDIIQIFKDKDFAVAQQSYVFILNPLRSNVPYFILAAPPVIKGENKGTVETWISNAIGWAKANEINIFGLGADGDSKVRAYYLKKFSKPEEIQDITCISICREDFLFYLPLNAISQHFECPFPDPRHLIKKWRNQLLNVRRLLIFGLHTAQLEHLMEIADNEKYKHTISLWKTDIKVSDKQNVNAAVRLFDQKVQDCLLDCNSKKYKATVYFLQLGTMLNTMYFDKDMHVSQRIRNAWTLVQFLRIWKIWTKLSGYKIDKHFISDQTFHDILIASHSLILFGKHHFERKCEQPFEPWTWGSNACEEVFSKARCFVRTKNNFCHVEFLDICRRLQKVSETEKDPNIKTKSSYQDLNCASFGTHLTAVENIDSVIKEEMKNGDKIACKMALEVGMHHLLLASEILQFDNSGELEIKDNLAKVNPTLSDISENDPDELKVLNNDEIESLNTGDIIITTLGNDHQTIHSADLLDLATNFSVSTDQHESICSNNGINPDILDSGTIETIPPSETEIVHPATPGDHSVEDSPKNIEEYKSSKSNPCDCGDSELKKNTHIFYHGRWYHINQFVGWEQGKFYMPKQARLNRFYSNYVVFDKFITTKSNTNSDVSQNTYIATWNNGKYTFGIVKRLIKQSFRGKSAYPIFLWDKTSKTEDVEMAIQIMLPFDDKSTSTKNGLSRILRLSKKYTWITAKDYVTNLQGHGTDDTYTLDEECFLELQTVLDKLLKQDELEEKKKREAIKRKHDEQKKGPPEKMTVSILKTVLKEKGVRFASNARKGDLIQLVRQQLAAQNSSNEGKPYFVTENKEILYVIFTRKAVIKVYFVSFPEPSTTEGVERNIYFGGKRIPVNDTIFNMTVRVQGYQASVDIPVEEADDFTSYEFEIKNTFGSSSYIVRLAPANQPETLSHFIALAKQQNIEISWKPEFNGGYPQSFVVEVQIGGQKDWTPYEIGLAGRAVIDGLEADTYYNVRMFSKNMIGASNVTDTVQIKTETNCKVFHSLSYVLLSWGTVALMILVLIY